MQNRFNEISAVTERILREFYHSRRMLTFWIIFPALMLLLFGLIFAGDGNTGKSFDYYAPGILIGAALFFSCLGGPVTIIVAERERGTLRRLLVSPLRPSSYFFGITFAHIIVALGQAVIVYGIAIFFGGGFHGSIALGILIVLLSVYSYVGLGFFFGARLAKKTEDATGPISAIGVPLLILGGTFFNPSILPDYLLVVAYINPIYHMNEALKGVSAGGASFEDVFTNIVFLFLFTLLSLTIGIFSYRKMLLQERTKTE